MAYDQKNLDTAVQFIKYCGVGVLNTAIGLSIIYFLKYFFSFADAAANLCGYLAGLCFSYVVNGLFTFKTEKLNAAGLFRFFLVFCIAYSANLITTLFLIEKHVVNAYIAHLIGVAPYTLLSFAGSKLFVYKVAEQI